MGKLFAALVTATLVQQSAPPVVAGRFLDNLVLQDIDLKQGRKFELVSAFRYEDPSGVVWIVPEHFVTDGASIPRALWTYVGGPWEGPYRRPAVIHDYFFETKRYESAAVHRVFYDAMLTAGVPILKAKLMYWAVVRFNDEWKSSPIGDNLSCGPGAPRDRRCIVLPPDTPMLPPDDVRVQVKWDAGALRAAEERINKNNPSVNELERDALEKRKAGTREGR